MTGAAAFKSTTKRSPIDGGGRDEDDGSSNRNGIHRQSRSLSRYSGRFVPAESPDSDVLRAPPSGRFVNKVRGSSFPEISLDDLSNELFPEKDADEVECGKVGGRFSGRISDFHSRMDTESSRRRGRSVSRKESFESNSGSKGVSDSNLRRRRSVSTARYRCSDSERYSSTVTDDEGHDSCSSISGAEKTIRTVYAPKRIEHPVADGEGTGLYEAMCKEVRHAVEDIRTELKKVMADAKPSNINDAGNLQLKGSGAVQAIAEMRRTYTTKLEESEKRKQELLTELAAEEERRQKLTTIVRDLLPEPKRSAGPEKPSRVRRKSNDKTRMSKQLNEEAEKYFEDFISNVEDTDISSFDGERSDTSSTMGGSAKSKVPVISSAVSERRGCLSKDVSLPLETDGIVLPWLQWETSYGSFSPNSKSKIEVPGLSSTHLLAVGEAATSTFDDNNNHTTSSRGSWSPNCEDDNSSSAISRDQTGSRFGEVGSCQQGCKPTKSNGSSSFDMDEYMHLHNSEDLLYERLRQRHRIHSGSLILCGRNFI